MTMTAIDSRIAKQGIQTVTTSFYGVGGDASIIQSVHLRWDATFAAVITFETSNIVGLDPTVAGVAGEWIQENPTTAYIGATPAGLATNMTITVPGGTAGGAMVHVGNLGSRVMRVKVVCSVQGLLVITSAGKE
jgi:hypothetical protein